jgi:hypothetical protein
VIRSDGVGVDGLAQKVGRFDHDGAGFLAADQDSEECRALKAVGRAVTA